MNLTINGVQQEQKLGESTLPALLSELSLDTRPVVIEYNGEALLPREYDSITLKDGDSLEIVQVVAGG